MLTCPNFKIPRFFHQSANPVCLDNQTQRSPPKLLENPQKRTFQAGRVSSFFLSVQLLLTAENGPIKVDKKNRPFFRSYSGFSWDSSAQAQLTAHLLSSEPFRFGEPIGESDFGSAQGSSAARLVYPLSARGIHPGLSCMSKANRVLLCLFEAIVSEVVPSSLHRDFPRGGREGYNRGSIMGPLMFQLVSYD